MCEGYFLLKSGELLKEKFPSLDALMDRVESMQDLVHYRCVQLYGKKKVKKVIKKEHEEESNEV